MEKMNIDGNKVKIMYAELGLTQQQFADLAGMNRSVLSRLLNKNSCRRGSLDKIAKALNVEPETLLKKE